MFNILYQQLLFLFFLYKHKTVNFPQENIAAIFLESFALNLNPLSRILIKSSAKGGLINSSVFCKLSLAMLAKYFKLKN